MFSNSHYDVYRSSNRQGMTVKVRDEEGITREVENKGPTRDYQALVKITMEAEVMSLDQGSEVLRIRNRKRIAKADRRRAKRERITIIPWALGRLDTRKIELEKELEQRLKDEESYRQAKRQRVRK